MFSKTMKQNNKLEYSMFTDNMLIPFLLLAHIYKY